MNKKELRNKIRALRDALSFEERKAKSERIASKVISLQEFQSANVILLYDAIRREVETSTLFSEAKRSGKPIFCPRVNGREMDFYLVDEETEFEISKFGIQEPVAESIRRFVPNKEDKIFVVIPGMVFDEEGNRIGYGRAYYDKYLHWLQKQVAIEHVCKTALAYECQMVPTGEIENKSHDVKLDYVVTEEKCYKI